ncbi:hypothetical protein [Chitinophaga sp. GbtcB8]|uniref:hypothetical protein n=1 Tax=Chitinophaga sp. GbtcB8 TaxID=2824753 RepID=UPI001C3101BB|nr:hypothetical protein [Chitinophaga sp. GbtcB8]
MIEVLLVDLSGLVCRFEIAKYNYQKSNELVLFYGVMGEYWLRTLFLGNFKHAQQQ